MDENKKWLLHNKKHHLYTTWKILHQYNDDFLQCCFITVERLAKEFSNSILSEWIYNDKIDIKKPLSVIYFGEFGGEEHAIIINNGVIHESFYKKISYKKTKMNDQLAKNILNGKISKHNYPIYQLIPPNKTHKT